MKNKAFAAIFSLLLAFGLWMYVITVVSPDWEDSFTGIPVSLQSEAVLADRGLIITKTNSKEVTLRLAGNRSDLASLNNGNIRVLADVSKIYEPGVHNVSYTVSYPGNIPAGAVGVQSKNPDTIQIVVEQLVSKEVDVVIQDTGKVPANYLCDLENAKLSKEKVTISGPKSLIDQITQARIKVDLTEKTQTIVQDFPYTLCDRDGVPVEDSLITKETEEINMILRIVRIKTIPLDFAVIYGGGVTDKNVTITYDLSEIQISGGELPLNALNKLSFTVDISEMLEGQALELPIVLPAGITNETGIDVVTATIEFHDLAVKNLRVDNFEFINVPGGQTVDLIKKVLEINLRGPAAQISRITEEDVVIVLDFSNAKPDAMQTVNATIRLAAEFADVGAVGSYTVSATLRAE